MSESIYEDLILGASDVCSNCYRLVRVERVDPTRSGLGTELEAHQSRHPRNTEIGYGPSEAVSKSKGVFCHCGSESARHRVWSADDVDRDRFKTLLIRLIATLERKGVSLKRKEAMAYCLQAFDDDAAPDEAFATGVDAGVVAAAAASGPD